jgi:hypothetical protein
VPSRLRRLMPSAAASFGSRRSIRFFDASIRPPQYRRGGGEASSQF